MNIVKNIVVPAIGLSFLLGGVAAFAGTDGDNGDDSGQQGMKTYLVGDQANSDGSTATDQEGTTYLVGDENEGDGDSWGSADDQGTSTYLIGDNKEDKNASVQLVAHHEKNAADKDDGENDADSTWLV